MPSSLRKLVRREPLFRQRHPVAFLARKGFGTQVSRHVLDAPGAHGAGEAEGALTVSVQVLRLLPIASLIPSQAGPTARLAGRLPGTVSAVLVIRRFPCLIQTCERLPIWPVPTQHFASHWPAPSPVFRRARSRYCLMPGALGQCAGVDPAGGGLIGSLWQHRAQRAGAARAGPGRARRGQGPARAPTRSGSIISPSVSSRCRCARRTRLPARAAINELTAEVGLLGDLIHQIATTLADHDEQLAAKRLGGCPAAPVPVAPVL